MKCKRTRELMGGYLYGDLAPDEMKQVRLHTQDCTACREDLAGRGGVVSALGDVAPQLSEEDRQQITWSVKGAISAQARERRTLGIRLAPTLGLATVLLVGFAVGALVSSRVGKPPPARAAKRPAEPTVTITRDLPNNPQSPKAQPTEQTAVTPHEDGRRGSVRRTLPIHLIPVAYTNRAGESSDRGHNILPDAPLQVVPTPESEEAGAARNVEKKLPRPVDLDEADAAEPVPDH